MKHKEIISNDFQKEYYRRIKIKPRLKYLSLYFTMPHLDLVKERETGLMEESYESERGTRVEMIRCPTLGMTCFMDGLIQSSEMDEKNYHVALVERSLLHTKTPDRVLILGGGEGAVAREVLSDPRVHSVDMYDWDAEVVRMFRERYPRWGKTAWEDERLHIYHEDVFEMAKEGNGFAHPKYNLIIIDLFDVTEDRVEEYKQLVKRMANYLEEGGEMVMYVGLFSDKTVLEWMTWCLADESFLPSHSRCPYRTYIPSFEGEASFMAWLTRE